jgi:hypothetical protein
VTVRLVERRDPASEEQVAAAERLLEVRLPEQYRRFLVEEANGARPEQNLLHDDESGAGVDEYLGIDQSGDSDLVVVYETFREGCLRGSFPWPTHPAAT